MHQGRGHQGGSSTVRKGSLAVTTVPETLPRNVSIERSCGSTRLTPTVVPIEHPRTPPKRRPTPSPMAPPPPTEPSIVPTMRPDKLPHRTPAPSFLPMRMTRFLTFPGSPGPVFAERLSESASDSRQAFRVMSDNPSWRPGQIAPTKPSWLRTPAILCAPGPFAGRGSEDPTWDPLLVRGFLLAARSHRLPAGGPTLSSSIGRKAASDEPHHLRGVGLRPTCRREHQAQSERNRNPFQPLLFIQTAGARVLRWRGSIAHRL